MKTVNFFFDYKQQKFISYSSAGWTCKIKVMVNSVSSENLLPHRPQSSHCNLTWQKANAVIFLKHKIGKPQFPLIY